MALLINERQHVEGLGCEHVEGGLVVLVLHVRPDNVFPHVLVLLQLEDVPDKELLQLLIGKIDAQLLKAGGVEVGRDYLGITKCQTERVGMSRAKKKHLLWLKFSKPKMSSKPMDCWTSSGSSCSL